jgi:hypothetical protein
VVVVISLVVTVAGITIVVVSPGTVSVLTTEKKVVVTCYTRRYLANEIKRQAADLREQAKFP